MTRLSRWSRLAARWSVLVGAVIVAHTAVSSAQGPPAGRGHMGGDPAHMADMGLIHELLDSGDKIQRTVTVRPDGVETLTESDDPELAKRIRAHVDSMYARVENVRPIHMRDPLFRAIFEHASKIVMVREQTPKGIKVVETSTDPYVVKLIQAHAEVVSQFIKNGRAEAMKNHEVPSR
jgi:hypothetical protein